MTLGNAPSQADLERLAEEQAALLGVATLVAEGADETRLAEVVCREIGRLFDAERAYALRWSGERIRVIGEWNSDHGPPRAGGVYPFGGDTVTARVVETGAPARVNSAADLETAFARHRWAQLGLEAAIGAPVFVDGRVWGIVTAARTQPDDPFPDGAEQRLREFAALVAQSIVNAEARRETAELLAEQSALRHVATLVAEGRPRAEVLDAAMSTAASIFDAESVALVRPTGMPDEVRVVTAWAAADGDRLDEGTLLHLDSDGTASAVLEIGLACRGEDSTRERGACAAIGAPVIIQAELYGALVATRPAGETFPSGSELRLRSFADLAAQSIQNEQAQAELRASRARIVRAADETRARFERNLHDGAQQRLVAVSVSLRLAAAALASPERAGALLGEASEELAHALAELRDLGQGLHPAVLAKHGIAPALEALASRAPLPVVLEDTIECRLTADVEAALYYVVAESLTNVAKHASATSVRVRTACGEVATVEVVDDGVGGATASGGSGIRGLADRIEALGGRFGVESTPGEGTRVWAEVPIDAHLEP
jgi:signal transduction histidine kinase